MDFVLENDTFNEYSGMWNNMFYKERSYILNKIEARPVYFRIFFIKWVFEDLIQSENWVLAIWKNISLIMS